MMDAPTERRFWSSRPSGAVVARPKARCQKYSLHCLRVHSMVILLAVEDQRSEPITSIWAREGKRKVDVTAFAHLMILIWTPQHAQER